MPDNGIIPTDTYRRVSMKEKNTGKKIIAAAIVLIIIAALLLYFFKFRNNNEQEYKTDTVQMSSIDSSISIKGTVSGLDDTKVYSDSVYSILSIPVKKGDVVKKNQVLAKLDITKLQQQYDIASIDYEIAKKNYEDTVALYKTDAVPQNALYQAEMALKKAELTLSTFDIENAGEIVSPIDGVVTEINCSEGSYASFSVIQQPAFVIEDRSQLTLKAKAKEKHISSISVGQDAEITFEVTGDEKFSGKVTEIGPSGKVNQGNGEVEIPVTIEIETPKDTLMTGVTGKAVFTMSAQNTLTIPIDAVSAKNDETCVYVLTDDKSTDKVIIETGIDDGDRIQVIAGEIKEGDKVVIDPDAYMFK